MSFSQKNSVCNFTKDNLESLNDTLLSKIEQHKVPGMAVVIVKGNEVMFKETYGYSNVEKKLKVDENTIFPIGSSSKPFTATLIAKLVSEGKMSWDDPVDKYLPYFQLELLPEGTNTKPTIRDLLSHRTGIFSMELTQKCVNWGMDPNWNAKDDSIRFSREALIKAMTKIAAKDTFRLKHNYSNVGITAAAVSSAKATGFTWDNLIEKKLFKPLSMNSTSTLLSQVKDMNRVSKGYLAGKEGNTPIDAINLDVISPAGGINSSINDMGEWLKFLLSKKSKVKINDNELNEMWTKQVEDASLGGMLPGYSYGLGWFIKEWNNYKVVEHMGNALGFSANLTLIPELGVGYVVLSNLMPNNLQYEIDLKYIIWEQLIKL